MAASSDESKLAMTLRAVARRTAAAMSTRTHYPFRRGAVSRGEGELALFVKRSAVAGNIAAKRGAALQ